LAGPLNRRTRLTSMCYRVLVEGGRAVQQTKIIRLVQKHKRLTFGTLVFVALVAFSAAPMAGLAVFIIYYGEARRAAITVCASQILC
jgi:hypothetical protein